MDNLNRKKLYRNPKDKIFAGIFGGLGDYLDIDSNFLRIIGLILFALTAFIPFLIIYFITIFIVPVEIDKKHKSEEQ